MDVRQAVADNADRYIEWLREACAIPSLADRPDALDDMAAWLTSKLVDLGADVARLDYPGAPPAILGRLGSGSRTVLVYDHYDVQPVDPIDLWDTKPFDPDIRDGRLFARGAADNKGDLVARLAGIDVFRQVHGDLPVAVKFFVEGEEEIGSKNFDGIVSRYGADLAADGCIWEGHGIDHAGRPELVCGAKGLAYVELNCRGLADDQHSAYAVIAPSPVWRLVEALATLRDPDGRVLIDGFYDDVRGPTDKEEALFAELPFEEEAERARFGITEFVGGATGLDLVRRYYFEPTCNIAGLVAGFTVPGGSKTVLPKEATAKLDMRLVPDQDPSDVVAKLRRHLSERGYSDIDVIELGGSRPAVSPVDSDIAKAATRAAERVFDQPPAMAPLMVGTGPMYPIAVTLGIPTVSPAGVHRPDSNIHAPNENCRVDDYLKIIEYTVAWLEEYGSVDG